MGQVPGLTGRCGGSKRRPATHTSWCYSSQTYGTYRVSTHPYEGGLGSGYLTPVRSLPHMNSAIWWGNFQHCLGYPQCLFHDFASLPSHSPCRKPVPFQVMPHPHAWSQSTTPRADWTCSSTRAMSFV